MSKLHLEIVTQEKHLLSEMVEKVTAMTSTGEVTILPQHLSLFTKLDAGEVKYQKDNHEHSYVISGGFMDVSGGKTVTILADSAVPATEITLAKAQEAVRNAQRLMEEKTSQREFLLAEAQLRRALMELKIARRRKSPIIGAEV